MNIRTPFKWDNANFAWDNGTPFPNQSKSPFTWDDCALITEIVDTIANGGFYQDLLKDKEKKKRFIKILCIVEGKEYKETKEIINRKIRISDISLVAKEVLGINIKVDL
jgi:hypothetical protein